MLPPRYTVHNDQHINAFIQGQLDTIVREIHDLLGPRLDAVLLCGGFGRGEGGMDLSSGNIRVVNDYDLTILLKTPFVINYRRYARRLHHLAEALAPRLRVKQVDFSIRSRDMLEKKPVPTVAYYELIEGQQILYGEPLRPAVSDLSTLATQLPLTEGTVYFLNRGSGLLIAARYVFYEEGLSDRDRENFLIEIDKSIMAIGDTMLISKGAYHYSYEERLRRIKDIGLGEIKNGNRIGTLYARAIENKLRPGTVAQDNAGSAKWWFEVQSLFGQFFLDFESGRLSTVVKDWSHYSEVIPSTWRRSYAQCAQAVLSTDKIRDLCKIRFWSDVRLRQEDKLLQIMPLLLFSLSAAGTDRGMLERAATLLGLFPEEDGLALWTRLVNRYLLLYHPGGAAGEVARRTQ